MTLFALVSESRSGSSVIDEELNQHRDVACLGEVARQQPEERGLANDLATPLHLGRPADHQVSGAEFAAWTAGLAAAFPDAKAVGFKLLAPYLDGLERGLATAACGVDRFVWLRRRNVLRRALSGLVVRETGVFNARQAPDAGRRMTIPVKRLIRRMHASQAAAVQLRQDLSEAGRPFIEVSYEDFVADRAGFYPQILSFLGVTSDLPPLSNLKVMVPERLEDLAENYAEVASAVDQAGFGEWLPQS